jgi:hypothetical protein
MTDHLGFGLSAAVPENAPAAWGARLIVTQSGDVDLVPDRQSMIGPEIEQKRLAEHLNAGALKMIKEQIGAYLKGYRMLTREGEEIEVYSDDLIVARANTNGSCGYCYVAAWFVR